MKRKRLNDIRSKWYVETGWEPYCKKYLEAVLEYGRRRIYDVCDDEDLEWSCTHPDEEHTELIANASTDIDYLTHELKRIHKRTANRMYTLLLVQKSYNNDLSKDVNKKIYNMLCEMEL